MNRYKWLIMNVYIYMMLGYIDRRELYSASDILFTIRYRTFDETLFVLSTPINSRSITMTLNPQNMKVDDRQ